MAEALVGIDSAATMQNFLRDVMTEQELIEISSRLRAARMLSAGKTYAQVVAQTKLSSRTVARISDWMQNGCGGYATVFARLSHTHGHLPPAQAA